MQYLTGCVCVCACVFLFFFFFFETQNKENGVIYTHTHTRFTFMDENKIRRKGVLQQAPKKKGSPKTRVCKEVKKNSIFLEYLLADMDIFAR